MTAPGTDLLASNLTVPTFNQKNVTIDQPCGETSSDELTKVEIRPVFKAQSFEHSSKFANKKRAWKSLKQVIASERSLPWPEDCVHYSAINAPPSFRPAERFSDLSGLPAPYTDPQTRLRFANKEEYATIIELPMDITAGYLALRGASSIVG